MAQLAGFIAGIRQPVNDATGSCRRLSAASVFVSAGLGFRYYSPIGPVRLDIGVPLERRRDTDAPVQLYVSLGQAF